MSKLFKETVEERAKRDPEFKKALEEERLKMSNLTDEQVEAITHAWLDLCASKEHFEGDDEFVGVGANELAVACKDSAEELEQAFPFLLQEP